MGKLNRKFKKLVTSHKLKMRDAGIVISQYLKDVHGQEISPKDIYSYPDRQVFFRNWYLAKAYFAQQFGIPLVKNNTKPKDPEEGRLWVDKDYNVYQYHLLTGQWLTITEPKLPYGQAEAEEQTEKG